MAILAAMFLGAMIFDGLNNPRGTWTAIGVGAAASLVMLGVAISRAFQQDARVTPSPDESIRPLTP